MYTTTLSPQDIEVAKSIPMTLSAARFPINSSIWIFNAAAGEWRLLIAAAQLEKLGPTGTYQKVLRILRSTVIDPNVLNRLWVVSTKDPIYKSFRRIFAPIENGEVRVSNSRVNGIQIDDAIVCFLK